MIVKDPEIQGGVRTFKDTRIPSGLPIGSGNAECSLGVLGWRGNKSFNVTQLRLTLMILEGQLYAIREAWKNHFQG
jgi:hypothetical protein